MEEWICLRFLVISAAFANNRGDWSDELQLLNSVNEVSLKLAIEVPLAEYLN